MRSKALCREKLRVTAVDERSSAKRTRDAISTPDTDGASREIAGEVQRREQEHDAPERARPYLQGAEHRSRRQQRQHGHGEDGELQRRMKLLFADGADQRMEPRLLAQREHHDRAGGGGEGEPSDSGKRGQREHSQRRCFRRTVDAGAGASRCHDVRAGGKRGSAEHERHRDSSEPLGGEQPGATAREAEQQEGANAGEARVGSGRCVPTIRARARRPSPMSAASARRAVASSSDSIISVLSHDSECVDRRSPPLVGCTAGGSVNSPAGTRGTGADLFGAGVMPRLSTGELDAT